MAFSKEYDYASSKMVYTFPTMTERLYTSRNADITFAFRAADGEYLEIPSHRYLLASINPVFAAIMADPSTRFEISDVSYTAFKHFLDYFYKQEVHLTPAIITDMVFLAKQFRMGDLLKCCESYLREMVSAENVCEMLITHQHIVPVVQQCGQVISRGTEKVLQTQQFLHCDQSVLRQILQLEYFAVPELSVFEACVEWARIKCAQKGLENTPKNWRSELGDCAELIRFNEMTKAELEHCIQLSDGFFTSLEVLRLSNAAYVPNGRFTVHRPNQQPFEELPEDLGFSEY